MRVQSWEQGERPPALTRARMQAPAAKKALVELLSKMGWADMGYVVLDWAGTIAFVDNSGEAIDDPALDTGSPVMYIQTLKSLPQYGGTAVAEWNVDIDDVFGGNEIQTDDLIGMVISMKETIEEQVDKARNGGSN